jgi:hypothetical protein
VAVYGDLSSSPHYMHRLRPQPGSVSAAPVRSELAAETVKS